MEKMKISFIRCKMLCISLLGTPPPLEIFSFHNQVFSFCFQIWFKTCSLLSEALDDLGVKVGL